jgi:hypothetical protein
VGLPNPFVPVQWESPLKTSLGQHVSS